MKPITNFLQSKYDQIIASLEEDFPGKSQFTRKEIKDTWSKIVGREQMVGDITTLMVKASHGVYNVYEFNVQGVLSKPPTIPNVKVATVQNVVEIKPVIRNVYKTSYIPEIDPLFVKWGAYKDVLKILKTDFFYPIFITGLSGNGKTMMVEQAAANAKREFIRVQISPETDQDDLIGGFRLVDGNTVFEKGPVVKAMELGAILLIDEIDRGSNKIMALQGVLEGKPIVIKKTGEIVYPKKGFNVIATANTKGQGSDSGKFSAATIIDEAFLERFTIAIEQPFPTIATEEKILINHMNAFGKVDVEFAKLLVSWADGIRKTYYDDGVDDVISTRRLGHIVQTYAIFEERMKSIDLAISRFDEETKNTFKELYTKFDASIVPDNVPEV
jgi:cobaltochelatase CobS